jgi:hypothetical protein
MRTSEKNFKIEFLGELSISGVNYVRILCNIILPLRSCFVSLWLNKVPPNSLALITLEFDHYQMVSIATCRSRPKSYFLKIRLRLPFGGLFEYIFISFHFSSFNYLFSLDFLGCNEQSQMFIMYLRGHSNNT